jgi:hypothetical protein
VAVLLVSLLDFSFRGKHFTTDWAAEISRSLALCEQPRHIVEDRAMGVPFSPVHPESFQTRQYLTGNDPVI